MLSIFEKILDKVFGSLDNYDKQPDCESLLWTLPDKIRIGKVQRMKSVCALGLKTGPTCGGFFTKGDPYCKKYEEAVYKIT